MIAIIPKAALVILAGVYAMRFSNQFFNPAKLQPLWFAAVLAFIMSLVLFYRPPTVQGWWQYTATGLCLVGVAANTILFFAPDAAHNTPTNLAFSAVSMVGWAIVAAACFFLVFAPRVSGS